MPIVFINYRREESAGEARALYGDLVDHLGADAVFMDVDSIALGQDFRDVVQQRLASCDVMLSLIGREWLEVTTPDGRRRLDEPDDFVRLEIEGALKRKIPVAPVLLHGTRMPAAAELPASIRDFAFRNAFELSHTRWQSDVQEMLRRLGLMTAGPDAPRAPAAQRSAPPSHGARAGSATAPATSASSRRALAIAGVLAVAAALLAAAYTLSPAPQEAPAAAAGESVSGPLDEIAADVQPPDDTTPDAAAEPDAPPGDADVEAGPPPEGPASAEATMPVTAREETPPIPRAAVRLGTQATGPESCLDHLAFAACGNTAGQLWRLEPSGASGTVRLHNQRVGAAKCLDVVNDGTNDRLAMADCGEYSGQSWTVSWAGPRSRFVRLQSGFTGPERCLGVVKTGENLQLRMLRCNNVAGQRWEIRPRER